MTDEEKENINIFLPDSPLPVLGLLTCASATPSHITPKTKVCRWKTVQGLQGCGISQEAFIPRGRSEEEDPNVRGLDR